MRWLWRQVVIHDGLQAVAEAKAGSLDVLIVDADGGDASQVPLTHSRKDSPEKRSAMSAYVLIHVLVHMCTFIDPVVIDRRGDPHVDVMSCPFLYFIFAVRPGSPRWSILRTVSCLAELAQPYSVAKWCSGSDLSCLPRSPSIKIKCTTTLSADFREVLPPQPLGSGWDRFVSTDFPAVFLLHRHRHRDPAAQS